jgi:hypothetical protein
MVSYFIVGDMNHSLPRNHPENQDLPGESEQVGVKSHVNNGTTACYITTCDITIGNSHVLLSHVVFS